MGLNIIKTILSIHKDFNTHPLKTIVKALSVNFTEARASYRWLVGKIDD